MNNVGSSAPVTPIVTTPVQKQVPADAPKQVSVSDRLELSGLTPFATALKNSVRADKVTNIKAQIANGTYDEDKKLDRVIDKLLDDVLK